MLYGYDMFCPVVILGGWTGGTGVRGLGGRQAGVEGAGSGVEGVGSGCRGGGKRRERGGEAFTNLSKE